MSDIVDQKFIGEFTTVNIHIEPQQTVSGLGIEAPDK
jgi:hypothetical protein